MAPSPLINDDKRHAEECTPRKKKSIKTISHHDRMRKVSVPDLQDEGLKTELPA